MKARKHSSNQLRELLGEVTPLEMEQTKVKMQLAAKIEDLMNAKGWSKSEFAEKAGKNPSEITKWLSGTNNFTTEVLTEIAFTFGVCVASLYEQKSTPVVYRKEITAHTDVTQPMILIITPYGSSNDLYRKRVQGGIQNENLPITQMISQC